VTVGPLPSALLYALAVAIFAAAPLSLGLWAALYTGRFDDSVLYPVAVVVVTILVWPGFRVTFTSRGLVIWRAWVPRRIAWADVRCCVMLEERGAVGDFAEDDTEALAVELNSGKRIRLLRNVELTLDRWPGTALGRRTDRHVAVALDQLHAHHVRMGFSTLNNVLNAHSHQPLDEVPEVRALWKRTGYLPW
jgi:hypothetical protein